MAGNRPIYRIDGEGTLGLSFGMKLADKAVSFGIEDSFISAGWHDNNRISTQGLSGNRKIPLIAPAADQLDQGGGYLANIERARNDSPRRQRIRTQLNAAHVHAARRIGLRGPIVIWPYGHGAHREEGARRLAQQRASEPNRVALGVTVVPHEKHLIEHFRADPNLPLRLWETGDLECSIMFDNASTIARTFGRPFQDDLLVTGLISLASAPLQFVNQRNPAEVAHALGGYGPLVIPSFGLSYYIEEPEPWWYWPFSALLRWGRRGFGKLDDFVDQTLAAIVRPGLAGARGARESAEVRLPHPHDSHASGRLTPAGSASTGRAGAGPRLSLRHSSVGLRVRHTPSVARAVQLCVVSGNTAVPRRGPARRRSQDLGVTVAAPAQTQWKRSRQP
jgi:hypothetical protein